MPELYPYLEGFRVPNRKPNAYTEDLRRMGVPDELLGAIAQTHVKYQAVLGRLELKVLYSLIPRLNSWLKGERDGDYHPGSFQSYRSQAYSFVQRLDVLEKLLEVKRPRAPSLQKKLKIWNSR